MKVLSKISLCVCVFMCLCAYMYICDCMCVSSYVHMPQLTYDNLHAVI